MDASIGVAGINKNNSMIEDLSLYFSPNYTPSNKASTGKRRPQLKQMISPKGFSSEDGGLNASFERRGKDSFIANQKLSSVYAEK